ncbi:MAG: transglycosylase SLT domain-containing protein [Chitinivibrionales bacterium]|nr:transglycosylase SLT domain-containing protein [Chitinivibrionales bacterium]MBD3396538.1 transglycosylase SLT domain-containing protein [Chitinivibrionales bacterium]
MRIGETHNLPDHARIKAAALNAKPGPDAKRVAQEFESLFASIMLRGMRNTVARSELVPESLGEKIYTDMLDGEYAKLLSRNGSLGLAELILEEMRNHEDQGSVLAGLRGLNRSPWAIDTRLMPRANPNAAASLADRVSVYDRTIREAGETYGVDSSLIAAVIAQESAGDPYAVSRAGAKGLMQLMDSTAREVGVRQVFNSRQNIHGGTRYLRAMLDRHHGDERLALASYNAGPAAVDKYNGIPPYPETQSYVENVLRLREAFLHRNDNRDGEQ